MATRNGVGVSNEHIKQLDEAQFEVSKSLITWKRFSTKELAKEFLEKNKCWVGIVESKGAFFVASSKVNDIAIKAVELTNKYYKLNVPLAIDPQYGRNWAECH